MAIFQRPLVSRSIYRPIGDRIPNALAAWVFEKVFEYSRQPPYINFMCVGVERS